MKSQVKPFLQQESSTLQISLQVAQIIGTLERAKQGDLMARADLFSTMETLDAHIYSEMFKRKMAVSKLDWTLTAPRDALAREKKAILELENLLRDSLDLDTLVFNLADAIGKGFSCIEIEWKRNEQGLWMPKQFFYRPQFWFQTDFATRQQIRLRDNQTIDGVELIPNGWLVHRHSSGSEENVGDGGLYQKLALPYLFKNFAVKNWLRFSELYGVPMRVLFSNETDTLKKRQLLDALKEIGQQGAAVLSGMNDDFQTVDITKGEGQGFAALIDWCEKSVSKAILGATLTSDTGKNGNYATANVHNEVRNEIRDFDARQIAETINAQLIRAIVNLNSLNIRPHFTFDTQEPEDIALFAEAIPKLVAVGMKISPEYLHERLKIPMAEDGNVLQVAPPKTALSALSANLATSPKFTPAQQVIENLVDDSVEKIPAVLSADDIRKAVFNSHSAQQLVEENLALLLDKQDPRFAELLSQTMLSAQLLGFVNSSESVV